MKVVFLNGILLVPSRTTVMSDCTSTTAKNELNSRTLTFRKIIGSSGITVMRLRQASDDLSVRIKVYERLLGPTSDQVGEDAPLGQLL